MVEQVVGSGQAEHLACAPLLTVGAGGAAGSRGLSAVRYGGNFRGPGWYDGAGWHGGGEGGRVCRTLWLVGLAKYFWGRWREDPGWTREDARAVRANANLAQIWAKDGSGWTRPSGCVAPLGRALATRRSGRTRSDVMRRPAGDALNSVTRNFQKHQAVKF
jgi:hypothetical protein